MFFVSHTGIDIQKERNTRNVTNPDVEGAADSLSGSLFSEQSSPAVTSCCASSASLDPAGARWRVDTEDSRPSGKRTKADLLSRSHAGIDLPEVDRREKAKNRSWGVAFVEVHSNERTACRALGRTADHCSVRSPCDFKASSICSVQLGRCPEDCKESSCYTQCLCLVGIDGIHH
ncbi:hypothetical protein T02_63 [Trichinella nativa]|uniref:Uncharacterized protein n=1 Tax=Trichinella nativa TaxID=6335 RepID=A0A0V1LK90_9BILA|nr:hypothetical protein T02_63 [Trichinella nativa]